MPANPPSAAAGRPEPARSDPARPDPSTRAAASDRAADRAELGRRGEDVAAAHLQRLGFTVLTRNWRCRHGELDLVVTDGRLLVVAEVKTRSGRGFGDPAEAVTGEKAARIRLLAEQWLSTFRMGWCPVRFDVLSVLWPPGRPPRLRHIEGAF